MSKESKHCDISQFAEVLEQTVQEWGKNVSDVAETTVHNMAVGARKTIKSATPKNPVIREGRKHYATCFGIKKDKKSSIITEKVYNTQYQLSHLLEDGHNVYTRLGKKNDPKAVKIGPLKIHNRTFQQGGVVESSTKTAKFSMWQKGEDYVEKNIVEDFKKELDKKR